MYAPKTKMDGPKKKNQPKAKTNLDNSKKIGRKFNPRKIHSETLLANNSYSYGTITDRFLPQMDDLVEHKLYDHRQNSVSNSNAGVEQSPPITITNNNRLDINTIVDDLSYIELAATTSGLVDATNLNPSPISNTHNKHVATALGFKTQRILSFKPSKNANKSKVTHRELNFWNDDFHQSSTVHQAISNTQFTYLSEIPYKVLDAPGLRNDFYSNLVCWANKADTIAAGLGSIVYCWNETNGTVPLQPFGAELVSAISYSSNDFLAVGTKDSTVYVYSPSSINIIASIKLKNNASICSIKWLPKSNYFFIGNDIGDVTVMKLQLKDPKTTKNGYLLKIKVTFKCDQQQICGIDINPTTKQLAIGANNNNSTIWDISDLSTPKKVFQLRHDAAVKAVAFCPWMPNLLATGGGSRDKNIRFWHSTSGTLIGKYKTKGQITAVVWSRYKREILVTFGFGENTDKNCILAIYSYPSMKLKIKVNSPPDLRILTADISNDFNSICASISDQSVRIYNIWNSQLSFKSGIYDSDIYGSEIIDTEEGVNKPEEHIR